MAAMHTNLCSAVVLCMGMDNTVAIVDHEINGAAKSLRVSDLEPRNGHQFNTTTFFVRPDVTT